MSILLLSLCIAHWSMNSRSSRILGGHVVQLSFHKQGHQQEVNGWPMSCNWSLKSGAENQGPLVPRALSFRCTKPLHWTMFTVRQWGLHRSRTSYILSSEQTKHYRDIPKALLSSRILSYTWRIKTKENITGNYKNPNIIKFKEQK